jgi:hypothetical protein
VIPVIQKLNSFEDVIDDALFYDGYDDVPLELLEIADEMITGEAMLIRSRILMELK